VQRLVALAVAAIVLLGCTIRLGPDYDPSILDGLSRTNEEAMVFFAGVAAGAPAGQLAKRELAYDSLIGKLDALRVSAAARPNPPTHWAAIRLLKSLPTAADLSEAELAAPTRHFLEHMVAVFVRMRERDRRGALIPETVALYKSEFEFEMVNALTYEKALKR
jgi:hypothetical protein